MTRIDDLVTSRVDVIKIDVEGHELEVAKGWSALFDRSPPSLVLTEYVPSLIAKTSNTTQPLDYLRFFLQRGYTIEGSAGDSIATTEAQLVRWSPRWMNDLVMRRARARVPQYPTRKLPVEAYPRKRSQQVASTENR